MRNPERTMVRDDSSTTIPREEKTSQIGMVQAISDAHLNPKWKDIAKNLVTQD